MTKKTFILLLTPFLFCVSLFPQLEIPNLTESSKVSLLTCTPDDEIIYTLFGHSGLRIQDDSLKLDRVYDYGIFDFGESILDFSFRFVKGETDYEVGARAFDGFMMLYEYREVGVTEQILNLSLSERQSVFDALVINSHPENRVYRYNFFYDNCATRPRDIIADNLEGTLNYTPFTADQTYRDLLDECLILTPWSRFGINIVIGSGADKIITERQKDFLPLYLSTALSKASVVSQIGGMKPLITHSSTILDADGGAKALMDAKEKGIEASNEPLYIGLVLLLLTIVITYLSFCKRKLFLGKLFDTLIFFLAGITGCIIFFLMFFSEHPCVDANWNLVWLNPFAMLFALFFFVKSFTKCFISYHFVNFVALTLFLVGIPFIPQILEVAFIPYILALWLRSGFNVLEYKKINR